MTKEKVLLKKVSWSLGKSKPCPYCKRPSKFEVSLNNGSVYYCGSKHCRKMAEKRVY